MRKANEPPANLEANPGLNTFALERIVDLIMFISKDLYGEMPKRLKNKPALPQGKVCLMTSFLLFFFPWRLFLWAYRI